MDTAAQYYLKQDVSELSDRDWCDVIARLTWLRTQEKEASEKTIW